MRRLMAAGLQEVVMVDLLARIVHVPTWRDLLHKPSEELQSGMQNVALRGLRPAHEEAFERGFAVDIEAEILDWFDQHNPDHPSNILTNVSELLKQGADADRLAEVLWLLSDWASVGTFRCMEERGFLYIEPYLNEPLISIESLYSAETWRYALAEIQRMTSDEFRESVILDWMARREELGATLDHKSDPHIMGTLSSHERNCNALHQLANIIVEPEYELLVAREWHSPLKWGFGDLNLGSLVSKGWTR